jgi:hypothetical protein
MLREIAIFGDSEIAAALARETMHGHYPRRIGNRPRAQRDGVENGKQARVDADSAPESEQRREREARLAAHRA